MCIGSSMRSLACHAMLAAGSAIVFSGNTALAQSKSAPKLTAPAAPQSTTTGPPPSAIGTPMTSAPSIAPLSAQISSTPLTGGAVRNDRLPAPTPPSDSPSQSAQSTAGGGGRTLQDCMRFWDQGTHMSKSEWRTACQRSAHRLDNLKINDITLGLPPKPATKNP